MQSWPTRRRVVALAMSPAIFVALATLADGWASGPGWLGMVAAASVVSGATLASYVPLPGTGRRLDVGCTPCAAVAALTVLGTAGILTSMEHTVPNAVLALGVAGFGLFQRVTSNAACEVPADRRPGVEQIRH